MLCLGVFVIAKVTTQKTGKLRPKRSELPWHYLASFQSPDNPTRKKKRPPIAMKNQKSIKWGPIFQTLQMRRELGSSHLVVIHNVAPAPAHAEKQHEKSAEWHKLKSTAVRLPLSLCRESRALS